MLTAVVCLVFQSHRPHLPKRLIQSIEHISVLMRNCVQFCQSVRLGIRSRVVLTPTISIFVQRDTLQLLQPNIATTADVLRYFFVSR